MTDTFRDRLAAAEDEAARATGVAHQAMRAWHLLLNEARDSQMSRQELVAYLDGLSEWEQEHGRGIFA